MPESEVALNETPVAEPEPTLPPTIRAFDQEGREVLIPREQWAAEVLPSMLQQAWDQPDHLYSIILNSLNDGFLPQVLDAAAHLYQVDPLPVRGTCVWAIVLIQAGRLVEAELVLTRFGELHGEQAAVLANLAKVYAAKGESARAEQTLLRSLELDPNLENSLGWFAAAAREHDGDAGALAALEHLRTHPASWRAQLWLARTALENDQLPVAAALYAEALDRAPRPVPPDLLMQMSGDLGGRGYLAQLLQYTAPHFVPDVHGLPIGNNLIKAHIDLGQVEAAATLHTQLAQFQRPDWRAALDFWQTEIAKRLGTPLPEAPATSPANNPNANSTPSQEVQIGMLRIDGPVWLPPGSPARSLFGAKPAHAPTVTFLGGSAEAPEPSADSAQLDREQQLAEALGRLTRSLPLFLAEQTEMRTAAAGRAMLPWAVAAETTPAQPARPSGFVVSAAPWPEAIAVQAVQQPENRSDYVVTVHLDAEVEPWEASLVFLRAADGVRIGELTAEFDPNDLDPALPALAGEVIELLSALGQPDQPPAYLLPRDFAAYLRQLEQLLAVRCTSVEGAAGQPLSNERTLLEGIFTLNAASPENIPARLLLIETMGAMQRTHPHIAADFRTPFEQLIATHPLPQVDAAFTPS